MAMLDITCYQTTLIVCIQYIYTVMQKFRIRKILMAFFLFVCLFFSLLCSRLHLFDKVREEYLFF